MYCNNLYKANLKIFRGILSASSLLIACVVHFLYILRPVFKLSRIEIQIALNFSKFNQLEKNFFWKRLSTSYKHILLSSYRFIVQVDAWMDKILGKSKPCCSNRTQVGSPNRLMILTYGYWHGNPLVSGRWRRPWYRRGYDIDKVSTLLYS